MRKFALLTLLLTSLAGCTTGPLLSPYGNFAVSPAAYDEKMAGDVVKKLVALYPPAHTRFNLGQVTPDVFGTMLVNSLREKGYALLEFKQDPEGKPANQPSTVITAADAKSSQQATGVDLRYVIDQQAGTNLYRVTVTIGKQSLTRAYVAQNNAVFPAGSWVRKE